MEAEDQKADEVFRDIDEYMASIQDPVVNAQVQALLFMEKRFGIKSPHYDNEHLRAAYTNAFLMSEVLNAIKALKQ